MSRRVLEARRGGMCVPGFSSRVTRLTGSATVEISDLVARKRREGANILSFSLGEPDFGTPVHVREAAKQALDAGHTHYTPGAGIMELREGIATAEQLNNIPCAARNVLVTPAKHAVMMALQAVAGPGDDVLVPDPGWVSYQPQVQWAEARSIPVPLEKDAFRMTPEAVAAAITPNTRAIIMNSPSNPTGGVQRPEDVRGIVELATDHDLWILSDEIYQKLLYEGKHVSPAGLPGGFERTLTINGLSKSFAMTGWRMGWLIAPDPAFKQINKLQSHSITHCTSFAQYGALEAVRGPQDSVAAMKKEFQARRKIMVEGLRAIPGVKCAMPAGAFYAFPDFSAWGNDLDVAKRLIEHGVAATPGSAFGDEGKGHLRFSYAASPDNIREGLQRIASAAP